MAQLEVGQIRIENGRIVIGEGQARTPAIDDAAAPLPPGPSVLGLPKWCWFAAAGASSCTGIVALWLGLRFGLARELIFLAPFFVFAIGSASAGVVVRRLRRRQAEARPEHRLLEERILVLLEPASEQATVEQIAAKTRCTIDEIVEALLNLKHAGRISEELNLATGEWYYARAENLSEGHLTLDERLEKRKGKR